VVAQHLAVVAVKQHQRVVKLAHRVERIEQPAELVIDQLDHG
jgi:hypothetical protein